jgi:glutamate synthase (NADH)
VRSLWYLAWLRFVQTFVPNANVGVDVDAQTIRNANDAVVISTGATWPRDLKIPNREADGIHFAMEFLQVTVHLYLRLPPI